tara:strand:- start:387 stop:563 length:177 start_codon:yes stop_codon:yes gene_type:complete
LISIGTARFLKFLNFSFCYMTVEGSQAAKSMIGKIVIQRRGIDADQRKTLNDDVMVFS